LCLETDELLESKNNIVIYLEMNANPSATTNKQTTKLANKINEYIRNSLSNLKFLHELYGS
jgi:hypothetical protein